MLGRSLGSLICFYLLASASLPTFANPVITLGILDWRDEAKAASSWEPTLAALKQQFPDKQIELHQLSLEGIADALAEQKLDYVITNPGHYVQLSQTFQLAPLATLNNPFFELAQQAVGSVLLVPVENQTIQTWQDLRGLKLGAVTFDAFGGFQLIWDELAQEGLDPKKDFVKWQLTGFPMEQLFDQLASGKVDAIIVRSCLAEVLAVEGRINLADYRVIGERQHSGYPCLTSSQLYPDWPFLSTGKPTAAEASKVLQALLKSREDQPAQWAAPLSYQPVYNLFERLRLGPFEAFPHNPLLNVIYRYRYLLMLGSGLLILLFAHHIRVGYLVRKRSQALETAMQTTQEKQQELAHLSRFAVMGELAAGLAHELNQPLTAIVNYAQGSQRLLQTLNTQTFPQQESLLAVTQKITIQGKRAADIIRNLRAFLRKGDRGLEQLEPQELLQEVRLFMEARLKQEEVELRLHLPEKTPLISVNRVEFLQIFINLISNALDAMQANSGKKIDVYVSESPASKYLVFNVIDQGEGLSLEASQRIFEPFFTTRKQGMGLGLSLSRSLAAAQGAKLELLPHSAGGVCARLEWPLVS
ncbi:sensor histidine kinase [Marinospirillum insulare]|uniref:histidine kinase n=1 Tax=Marinospirillum insulare TaxID=217169 RepID=A0ABQ5ZXH0_9GAMM|nr:PhnD/SsuA/transferrin family substrate-binding protein [Marinospirillum insulare]GLR64142.1 sensor histidine kinase [Marinospirillum insulare]